MPHKISRRNDQLRELGDGNAIVELGRIDSVPQLSIIAQPIKLLVDLHPTINQHAHRSPPRSQYSPPKA